jgi:hypothetical protein
MRPFPLGSGEMAAITLSVANRKFILAGTTSNGALPARAAKLPVDARVGAVCELALAEEQQYRRHRDKNRARRQTTDFAALIFLSRGAVIGAAIILVRDHNPALERPARPAPAPA